MSKNKTRVTSLTLFTLCVALAIFSAFCLTVSARADPLSVLIEPSTTQTPVGTQVQLFANITGGLPDYLYRWGINNVAISGDTFTSATLTFNATRMGTYTIDCQVRDSSGQYADAPQITIAVTDLQVAGQGPSQTTATPAETNTALQNMGWISAIVIVVVVVAVVAIVAVKKRKPKQSGSEAASK